MRVAVTGATGFLGRRLVRQLADAGQAALALTRRQPAESLWPAHVETLQADVTDPSSLARAFEGAEAVVHLAAVLLERGGQTFERLNAEGTSKVVAAAERGEGRGGGWPWSMARALPESRGARAFARRPFPVCTIARASLLFGEGDE